MSSNHIFNIVEANETDIEWINTQYKSISFPPSDLKIETVAIAYADQKRAGIGRVSIIDQENCELGGIYVLPEFRKQGLARKIVEFLLDHPSSQLERVFCLPFAHLIGFYESFGFEMNTPIEMENCPDKVFKKFKWCNSSGQFENEVKFMTLNSYNQQ